MRKEQLTPEQIQDIKIMYAKGIGIKSIMEKYPAIRSRNTIYYHIYKTPQEIQQLNPLDSINSKLDQILHLLKNNSPINDNLKNGSNKLNNVLNDLNNDLNTQKKPQKDTGEVQSKEWIKTGEVAKLCYFIDGKHPDRSVIQRAWDKWKLDTNSKVERREDDSYPTQAMIEALRYKNKNPKYRLTITDLENLIK